MAEQFPSKNPDIFSTMLAKQKESKFSKTNDNLASMLNILENVSPAVLNVSDVLVDGFKQQNKIAKASSVIMEKSWKELFKEKHELKKVIESSPLSDKFEDLSNADKRRTAARTIATKGVIDPDLLLFKKSLLGVSKNILKMDNEIGMAARGGKKLWDMTTRKKSKARVAVAKDFLKKENERVSESAEKNLKKKEQRKKDNTSEQEEASVSSNKRETLGAAANAAAIAAKDEADRNADAETRQEQLTDIKKILKRKADGDGADLGGILKGGKHLLGALKALGPMLLGLGTSLLSGLGSVVTTLLGSVATAGAATIGAVVVAAGAIGAGLGLLFTEVVENKFTELDEAIEGFFGGILGFFNDDVKDMMDADEKRAELKKKEDSIFKGKEAILLEQQAEEKERLSKEKKSSVFGFGGGEDEETRKLDAEAKALRKKAATAKSIHEKDNVGDIQNYRREKMKEDIKGFEKSNPIAYEKNKHMLEDDYRWSEKFGGVSEVKSKPVETTSVGNVIEDKNNKVVELLEKIVESNEGTYTEAKKKQNVQSSQSQVRTSTK